MKKLDQRGVTLIFEIIAVVAVLAVVGFVGTRVYQAKTGKSLVASVVPPKYTLNSKCDYNDPDLCKWLNNTSQFEKFRTTNSMTLAGKTTVYTTVVDGADKYQSITVEGGKESANFISIGDTSYTKDYSDGKWFKETLKAEVKEENTQATDDLKADVTEAKPDKLQYKKAGKEACGQLTCFKYDMAEGGATSSVYFDDTEYKLRKVSSTSGGQTFVVEYSYDSINIKAPSPTKDTPPAAVTPTGVPSQAEIDAALQQAQQAAQSMGVDTSGDE